MIRLNNDYNHGACDAVLQAIQQTNGCDYSGYGYDEWCEKGATAESRFWIWHNKYMIRSRKSDSFRNYSRNGKAIKWKSS